MLATDYEIDQERCRLAEECGIEAYQEGQADGAFGYKPQFINEQYLRGWLAGAAEILTTYPRDHQGRIQYPCPSAPSDPYQWLWDVGVRLREEWGLPSALTPDEEF